MGLVHCKEGNERANANLRVELHDSYLNLQSSSACLFEAIAHLYPGGLS